MGLRRRKREQIAAEVRAALAEFAAAVEIRLHAEVSRNRQTQIALIDAVKTLREDIVSRDGDLAHALENVTRVIDRTADSIDADRDERRALVEAVVALAQTMSEKAIGEVPPLPELKRGDRVLGGTIFGSATIELVPDLEEIERENAYRRVEQPASTNRGVEVQCRFGTEWVEGYEVFDVVHDDDMIRYRVRRLSDGSIPDSLFAISDVRPKGGDGARRGEPFRSEWA